LHGFCLPLLSNKRTIRPGPSNEFKNKFMVPVLVEKSLREFSQGLVLQGKSQGRLRWNVSISLIPRKAPFPVLELKFCDWKALPSNQSSK
jgi:hypothetical protein